MRLDEIELINPETGKSLNTDSHHHQDVTIRNHVDHVDVTIRILNF